MGAWMSFFVHEEADVRADVSLGEGTKVWKGAYIGSNSTLGENCIVGQNAYVDNNVSIGSNCKLQNNTLIYEPAHLGDGVFIGPGAILTNDQYPRAVNQNGELKNTSDWVPVGVIIEDGASIGAGAICVAPVTIGAWSMVAAGAVVTRDVPAYALVAGSPARQIGWVGEVGHRLSESDKELICPKSGNRYELTNGKLVRKGPSK